MSNEYIPEQLNIMDTTPFSDFETTSRAVLAYLHEHIGFDLWMMTRKTDADWVVLQTEDHGYNLKEGTVFHWSDSYCSRMVRGAGPRVAPKAHDVPAYVTAPISQQVSIGAYMGVPVLNSDNSLYGTLCAIDPMPQPESIATALPLVELQAKILGTILKGENSAIEQARLLKNCREEASVDVLTGILNRRGWNQRIAIEETRVNRYGGLLSIFIVDLDDLKQINDTSGHSQGDALLRRTADCLRATVRNSDAVARIGGDEFACLAMSCGHVGAEILFKKITKALSNAGIEASVGKATHSLDGELAKTAHQADRDMYTAKSARKLLKPF